MEWEVKVTYGIDECAEVQEDGVEYDHAGRLEGVAVDDIAACDCVSNLDSCCDWIRIHVSIIVIVRDL